MSREYETVSARESHVGTLFLSLAAVSAIACLALLWDAQSNYVRLAAAASSGFAAWGFSKLGKRRRIPVLRGLDELKSLVARTEMPVALYLRRFDDDTRGDHPPANESNVHDSDEEELGSSFSGLSLFVAVGRPGEPLPPWGAYRIYVPDQEWKKQVEELISIASIVVVRSGRSEPLRWEVDRVRRAGKWGRTLFLLPWRAATEDLRPFLPDDPVFDIETPEKPGAKRYAAFVTVGDEGLAQVHDRDRQLSYGASALKVACDVFALPTMTKDQRRAVRGFYGTTERVLETMTAVSLYGIVAGCATAMLSVLALLVPILFTEGSREDAILDIVLPVADPLLTGAGMVAAVSMLVLVFVVVLGNRLVPLR